jgi:hypothetical protein
MTLMSRTLRACLVARFADLLQLLATSCKARVDTRIWSGFLIKTPVSIRLRLTPTELDRTVYLRHNQPSVMPVKGQGTGQCRLQLLAIVWYYNSFRLHHGEGLVTNRYLTCSVAYIQYNKYICRAYKDYKKDSRQGSRRRIGGRRGAQAA